MKLSFWFFNDSISFSETSTKSFPLHLNSDNTNKFRAFWFLILESIRLKRPTEYICLGSFHSRLNILNEFCKFYLNISDKNITYICWLLLKKMTWLDPICHKPAIVLKNNECFWRWVDLDLSWEDRVCDKISYWFLKCAKKWHFSLTNRRTLWGLTSSKLSRPSGKIWGRPRGSGKLQKSYFYIT